jgi:hypothetical protein
MGRSVGEYAIALGVTVGVAALVAGVAPALLSAARHEWISDGSGETPTD